MQQTDIGTYFFSGAETFFWTEGEGAKYEIKVLFYSKITKLLFQSEVFNESGVFAYLLVIEYNGVWGEAPSRRMQGVWQVKCKIDKNNFCSAFHAFWRILILAIFNFCTRLNMHFGAS